MDELIEQAHALQTETDKVLPLLRVALMDATKECDQLMARVKELEDSNTSYEHICSVRDKRIAELEVENEKHRAGSCYGHGELAKAQTRIADLQGEIEIMKVCQDKMRDRRDQRIAELEAMCRERDTAGQKLLTDGIVDRKRINELEAALRQARDVGHNNDCMFCGFKDKGIIQALAGGADDV